MFLCLKIVFKNVSSFVGNGEDGAPELGQALETFYGDHMAPIGRRTRPPSSSTM